MTKAKRPPTSLTTSQTIPKTPSPPQALTRYVQQLLEPTVPFVTPGPAGYFAPVNVRITIPIKSQAGYVIVSPTLNEMLTIPTSEPSLTGWNTHVQADLSHALPSTQICIDEVLHNDLTGVSLRATTFAALGYMHTSGSTMVNGGKYYAGTWAMSSGSLTIPISAHVSGSYQIVLRGCNVAGPLGPQFAKNANLTGGVPSALSFSVADLAGLNMVDGFCIILTYSGTQSAVRVGVEAPTLTKAPGESANSFHLSELMVGRESSYQDISNALLAKCSAMSVCLTNGTPEISRGGFISMAHLPRGSLQHLPTLPGPLYRYIGSAPAVFTKVGLPLENGGHISLVRNTIEELQFHPPATPVDRNTMPVLVFVWDASTLQELTLTISMNWELSTLDTSLRQQLRSMDWLAVQEAIEGNRFMIENNIGHNPDHLDRIAQTARKVVSHPVVKAAAKAAMAVAPFVLAL